MHLPTALAEIVLGRIGTMIQTLDLNTIQRRTRAVILAIGFNHRPLWIEYIQHCLHRPVVQLGQNTQYRAVGADR